MAGLTQTPTRSRGRSLPTADCHRHDHLSRAPFAQAARDARGKRAVDIAIATTVLLVASLPMLFIAIAIKLESRGPVFFRVRRVGYRGRPLFMLKFRKMHDDASGLPLTTDDDARLTRVGLVLARTRLDELPQLWDVLRGRMAIVGPRPEDPLFVEIHARSYDEILSVRPGITGLSQLAFAEEHKVLSADNVVEDYVARILPQKIALDTLYSRSHRARSDVAVLGWTLAAVVLRRQVAVHRATGALTLRTPRPAAAASGDLVREALADAA